MKELQFSVKIEASKEKVWSTLWDDSSFRDWSNIIDEGTYLKGNLEEGNEVEFISSINGYGVTSLVEKLIIYDYVLFRHSADTKEVGQENRDKQWTGGTESYTLNEVNSITTLTINTEIPEELVEMFNDILPKALQRIKELSEITY